jgi:6-phospho-3-hexuloisomerase
MASDALDPLAEALSDARRIVLYGQGRTGLMMQAFVMRLYHLGLDAHMVGAMTTPPVGPGDLFVVNAATGDLATGLALIGRRKGRARGSP